VSFTINEHMGQLRSTYIANQFVSILRHYRRHTIQTFSRNMTYSFFTLYN